MKLFKLLFLTAFLAVISAPTSSAQIFKKKVKKTEKSEKDKKGKMKPYKKVITK